jgi:DNA modification methylase
MINSCYMGDVRDGLRAFIAAGIHAQTCVTSPPYWGLRDYGMPGQLGLESTPAEYVASMVEVFRLVRDVLADDGTLWLNLGDSYANVSAGAGGAGKQWTSAGTTDAGIRAHRKDLGDLKPKDLCGIPWRVAFALQADGWYLRSDIIWHKPNPMPESVTDRPTKAHEYLFLLAKSERYYYDAAAIAEPFAGEPYKGRSNGAITNGDRADKGRTIGMTTESRNRRTVWTIATQPYSEAHFAVMPRALVEPCVLAGSRVGDTVLDPFLGSGTVAQVAQDLGRHWIGCELNPEYVALQRKRTAQTGLALTAAD